VMEGGLLRGGVDILSVMSVIIADSIALFLLAHTTAV
jgi:hypothetical protein